MSDEQLNSIREIRSSVRRYYQKVVHIYATVNPGRRPVFKSTHPIPALKEQFNHFSIRNLA